MIAKNSWFTLNFNDSSACCTLDFSSTLLLDKDDAIAHNIKSIVDDFGTNLYVSMSGGMDSEFVAACFFRHGVAFTPVIVDYVSNGAEVWNAYYWCRHNNIKPLVINLTAVHMKTLLPHYAMKYRTTYVSAIDIIIDEVVGDGKIVTGSPEPFVRDTCLTDRLDRSTSQDLYVNTFDFTLSNAFPGKHPGSFFTYTPSMLYSIVKELDYTKPVQLALAEFYGVPPRPKVPALINTAPYLEIANATNSSVPLFEIDLGTKDELIMLAEQKGRRTFARFSRA